MTLVESFRLENCAQNRMVCLYTEKDGQIERGDPVNDSQEFFCDDRQDEPGKPDAHILSGWGQYVVDITPDALCPRCMVTNCAFNRG